MKNVLKHLQNVKRLKDKIVRNQTAFTLAETLITLAIIGIVATMTLSTLIKNYQEKVTVTKLKKAYNVFSQVFQMTVIEYGQIPDWGTYSYDDEDESDDTVIRYSIENFAKKFSNIKDCGFKSEGCFEGDYKRLNGDDERDFETLNNRYYKFIMPDGMAVAIEGYDPDTTERSNPYYDGEIWVDINGKSKPNVVGKDLFIFGMYRNDNTCYIEPWGYYLYKNSTSDLKGTGCGQTKPGHTCSLWVLEKENLDYLHCDDLSWSGKTKCD